MSSITMSEWVQNELYQELIQMPLWVMSAFIKDGEFHINTLNKKLIVYLVVNKMNRCPARFYNNDYRHSWQIEEYIPLFHQACITSDKEGKYLTINYLF